MNSIKINIDDLNEHQAEKYYNLFVKKMEEFEKDKLFGEDDWKYILSLEYFDKDFSYKNLLNYLIEQFEIEIGNIDLDLGRNE